jgi:NitT/TauT family transport system permease protein
MRASLPWRGLALVVLVLAWAALAAVAGKGFLPTPTETADVTVDLLNEPDTYTTLLITARRVAIAAIAACACGVTLGALMGLSRSVEAFVKPYVVVALSIPGPVYIIMAIIVLGIGETSTVMALVVSVIPFAANLTYQGVVSRDAKLDEMASVYRLGRGAWIRNVLVPQIAPTLLAAARTSFALAWKLVVLMEILSASDGVGAELSEAFKLLHPAEVVGYVATFMVLMLLVELLVFKRAERSLLRWRPTPQPT